MSKVINVSQKLGQYMLSGWVGVAKNDYETVTYLDTRSLQMSPVQLVAYR